MKDKKAIIITGANGNFGSYFAEKKLNESDYQFILLYHKKSEKIDRLKKIYPKRITAISSDLADIEDIGNKLKPIIQDYFISALLHTASVRSTDFKILSQTNYENWEYVIKANVIGSYNILKTVLPEMEEQKYGKIVLMGSNVSRIGLSNGSAYSASKAAIANLGRTISIEEAKNNILINTVSPGPIKIDESHFPPQYRKFRKEYYKKMLSQIPLNRLATLKDIFGIVDFLLSEKNSYITGEEIFVTGGKL